MIKTCNPAICTGNPDYPGTVFENISDNISTYRRCIFRGVPEYFKPLTIIAIQAVISADPGKTQPVLYDTIDLVVREAILRTDMVEELSVCLAANIRNCQEQQEDYTINAVMHFQAILPSKLLKLGGNISSYYLLSMLFVFRAQENMPDLTLFIYNEGSAVKAHILTPI